MLKHFGAWSVDAQSYDIAFLHPKSKGGDDDFGTLVCKWCSFETKAQRFDFWQVVKKRKLSRPPASYSIAVSHKVSADELQVSRPDGANGSIRVSLWRTEI